ncbi:MAG: hypothetical protein ABIJ37_01250 [Pseudomonadota bacterium]
MKRTIVASMLVAVLSFGANFSFAADQVEQIYGSELMTQQEQNEYRLKIRTTKTAEERERIRNEHKEQIKLRANEQGLTFHEEPLSRGGGMGYGGGSGRSR